MRFPATAILLGAAATSSFANPPGLHDRDVETLSKRHNQFWPDPDVYPDEVPEHPPKVYAMLLFPTFDMIDVFGPIDALNILSKISYQMTLYLVAETMDPVSTAPLNMTKDNPLNSSFFPTVNPTHTFGDVPDDVDVVIVPGGPGVRQPAGIAPVQEWLRKVFTGPSRPKHLLTICTGAGLVAETGLLDGKRATTNKFGWAGMLEMGPNVTWVSPARFVRDEYIWSSSGVTAGLDLIFEFIKVEYSAYKATRISGIIEHDLLPADEDNWADIWNVAATGGIVGPDGFVADGCDDDGRLAATTTACPPHPTDEQPEKRGSAGSSWFHGFQGAIGFF
ncbi:hypothetical protein MKZ38_005932 [Zalerion maritima]|uniref:DJ-1/PfpI domain-containing protein n=1 Tax=Zalerion maritima TaxID=339359 RepID=A0AAD5S3P8_9PEZI|nr:hypothetical protein MKZ38_005932 [Zalerion maritima]